MDSIMVKFLRSLMGIGKDTSRFNGDPLKISFYGFCPLGLVSDEAKGLGVIDKGADCVFDSLSRCSALEKIIDYFAISEDSTLENDCAPYDLRLTGYSYGAWSALQLTHYLADKYSGLFKIKIGTVDPVSTARSKKKNVKGWWAPNPDYDETQEGDNKDKKIWFDGRQPYNTVASNVVYAINYYQITGGATPFAPNSFFIGNSVKGADIDEDLSNDPMLRKGSAHLDILNTVEVKSVADIIFK